jgi:hypothetical protein
MMPEEASSRPYRGIIPVGLIVFSWALLAGCPEPGQEVSPSTSLCETATEPISLTRSSLGPIPLWVSLDSIQSLCPEGEETVFSPPESADDPAFVIKVGGVSAVGVQWASALSMPEPAVLWVVTGTGATLPGGIPIDTTWAGLRDAYEGASGDAGMGVQVSFDGLAGFQFLLDADPRFVGSPETTGDLSRIPSDSRIVRFYTSPRNGGE